MDPTALGPALGLVVGIAVGAVLAAVAGVLLAGRRRLERELAASRTDVAALRDRLDAVTAAVSPSRPVPPGRRAEVVITSLSPHAGPGPGTAQDQEALPRRAFASVALTESVIRLASLTHGVRRALSPRSRNRIRFEMGREVKRSRRQRRRELKEARRLLRRSGEQHATAVEDAA